MSDIIFIEQLALNTIIGVYPHEKTAAQPILLNLAFRYDTQQAAHKDNLSHTMDYDIIVNFIQQFLAQQHFNLIETLANRLADSLQTEFSLPSLKLTLRKTQAIPAAQAAGICVQRGETLRY
jgi:7,8-dihydroneopterin aldolase/epimerase/oxygenase